VVPLILEHRKYQKLNGTYIEGLMQKHAPDGRIHTSFDQTNAATGRISSVDPNLQNIPVRSELGREIRKAFVARPGWMLVDADYSQIELRVLAHMSDDPVMIDAFLKDQDIHRRTAAEVYGVPLEEVTGAMRSAAKAVNFGIVYGISDFGLARNIGVSRKQAAEFIERYLTRYAGIKRFMDSSVASGKLQGYVTTLFGRRRYLPEIASANYNIRSFGERIAMNSPIQGTAADIIKLAMVEAHRALTSEKLKARLILQVHDELIVDSPPEEIERASALLRSAMEGVIRMKVPLKVDLCVGRDWNACK
jgi:DNA polymerase-1